MIPIAICDDNPLIAGYVEECLMDMPINDISCEVFLSGSDLISHIENNAKAKEYPIYFMDIEMPGIDGIETSRYIRSRDSKAVIVFITSHKEYVYQVFEVLPFRFLTKPVTKEKLHTVLRDAIGHIQTMRQLFFFKIERTQYQVPFDKILYFESAGRKIKLVTLSAEYEFYGKLSNIIDELDRNIFVQLHNSYLANMEYITCISEAELTLENGNSLPISKKYRKAVKQQHLNFIAWRCEG